MTVHLNVSARKVILSTIKYNWWILSMLVTCLFFFLENNLPIWAKRVVKWGSRNDKCVQVAKNVLLNVFNKVLAMVINFLNWWQYSLVLPSRVVVCPSGHGVHWVLFSWSLYIPLGQGWHLKEVKLLMNSPGKHT